MAQLNNFNQPSNSNFENNQSQNQNPNIVVNQGNNQNSTLNNGYNQGQNHGPLGNMNQRQNQNRNQYQNQSQNQSQNPNQSQNQNQTSGQHGRNQRNPFGFNRFGNSYSNYYNNSNNVSNQENNRENPISNSEPQTSNNEPLAINNESQTRNNINQTIETVTNENTNSQKHDNEHINQNDITSLNSNYHKNENNQSSDDNSNHTRRMNHHNSELNAASIKNSFEVNDGGTPVIKLGGQYGFNLEKKMNVEHGIEKQGNVSSNVLEEDVLKISSVSVAERKHRHNKLYCSDKPYPKIEVSGENVDYAVYLLNDYSSSLSELTAITSYSFLNLILEDEYQEIKETYRGISIVEMRHLHMLGELIKKLGVLPRYYAKEGNQITMWSSNFVSGDTDMKTTLLNSIKNEEAGIIQYQKNIELIDDENVKEVLARIILDEEVHVSLLQELYNKYCPEHI